MQHRLSDGAGYLEIDHRESPGLTPAQVAHMPGALAVGRGDFLERDVKQCSHCQRMVVLEPARVRDRAVCPGCHHFICDGCETMRAASGKCVPFLQVLDRAATIAERFAHEPDHPDAGLALDDLRTPVATVAVPGRPQPTDARVVLTDAI